MAMDKNVLEAMPREGSGKGFARRLRAQKMIPAVIYGRHMETPKSIAVNPLAVRKAIATPHKFNTLLTLKIEGQGEELVLLKDFQVDPVSRDLLHVDFVGVTEKEPVKVKVPVVLVGKAEGVINGGILSQSRRELEVWALPAAIPEQIEVDVTALKIAQALHVNDLKMPEGLSVKTTVNFTIAVVTAPEAEAAPSGAAAAAVAGAAVAAAPVAAAAAKKEPAKK
jgi:large subunit ribosomal protein L25